MRLDAVRPPLGERGRSEQREAGQDDETADDHAQEHVAREYEAQQHRCGADGDARDEHERADLP